MHPILLKIGPITIYSFGALLALAFTAGIALALYRCRRYGINSDFILDLSLVVIISAIVGARLLFVMVNFDSFIDNPGRIFLVNEGGLVFFGGLIGVLVAGIPFVRKKKMNLGKIMDLFAPSVPLGQALGRIGCFLNGCCYGKITDSSCGIVFPSIGDGLAHHPTQIYEAIFSFFLAGTLLFIDGKSEKFIKRPSDRLGDGALLGLYLLLYSVGRVIIEIFRGDERGTLGFLSTSQLIGLVIGLSAFAFLFKRWKQ